MENQIPRTLTIATTLTTEFQDLRFAARAVRIHVPERLDSKKKQKFNLVDELKLFSGVLSAALRYPVLLLFSSRGYLKPELMATIMINLLPNRLRPIIIFYGEMYQPNFGLRRIYEKFALWLANRVVRCFIVYSQQDKESFAHLWGIDINKIRVSPYFTMHEKEDPVPETVVRGGHIFAGGKSFRDYEKVIEAAQRMPDLQFILATDKLAKRKDLPENITAGIVPFVEYNRLISTAAAILIPLQTGLKRSTGMLTYLEAMWAKNPIIITNALGVTEYVEHGKTGLIVDGTCEGYVAALQWILAPENAQEIQEVCENAHDVVINKFSFKNHITRVLQILNECLDEACSAQN